MVIETPTKGICSLYESLVLVGSLLIATTAAPANNQCVACHEDQAYFVEYPKLHQYYQQWLGSPHEQSTVTCDDCHGGDANATSTGDAHASVLPMNNRASTLHFQNQPETCGQCHRDIRSQFVQSKHYDELSGQRAAPTCTTCHPAMSSRPEFRLIILNACRNCHGPGNSENLPLITDQAENLFHQLNIAEGLIGWTRIHYESLGWPDDSRARMRDIDARHREILDWVHQFNLQETDIATQGLLDDLRAIFEDARRAHEERSPE